MLKVLEKDLSAERQAEPAKAPPAGKLPAGCSLSMVTSLRSVARLEPHWHELELSCATPPTIFQSFAWVHNWCQVYAQPGSPKEICLVVGRRRNTVVFIWPLVCHNHHGLRILTWASHPIGQYGDLLVAASEGADAWISAATRFLKDNATADIMHLRHVRATSSFGPYAARHWRNGKLDELAPALDLTAFKTDDDYSQRYDSQQRKRRKKAQRKMEEAFGPLTISTLAAGPEAERALDTAIAEKLKWLEARGRFNQVLSCPSHRQLLGNILAGTASSLRLSVMEMKLGDDPAAWEVGFEWNGVHYGYITSHREGLTDFGIGRLTLDAAQRQAVKAGMTQYDLMVPYDQHKESFSSHKEPVNDWYLPFTAKGRLYGGLYLGLTRPVARQLYRALPASILRVLKQALAQ